MDDGGLIEIHDKNMSFWERLKKVMDEMKCLELEEEYKIIAGATNVPKMMMYTPEITTNMKLDKIAEKLDTIIYLLERQVNKQ